MKPSKAQALAQWSIILILLVSVLLSNCAAAEPLDGPKRLSVVWTCCSDHADTPALERRLLTETNPGLGLNYKLTPKTWLEAGTYKNSLNRTANYLAFGAEARLFEGWSGPSEGWFDFLPDVNLKLGLMGGFVSGYRATAGQYGKHTPFAAPYVELFDRCRVLGVPGATTAVQCKIWKFGKD